MDTNEKRLRAEQFNLLNAQIGVLCQMYSEVNYAVVPRGLSTLLQKNQEVGQMIADLTKEIYE